MSLSPSLSNTLSHKRPKLRHCLAAPMQCAILQRPTYALSCSVQHMCYPAAPNISTVLQRPTYALSCSAAPNICPVLQRPTYVLSCSAQHMRCPAAPNKCAILLRPTYALVMATLVKRKWTKALIMVFSSISKRSCIAPSRPTFYRKRTVSQRKRENSRNRWWGAECKLCYLSHMLCIDKQWPGAIQSALSPA